MSNELFEVINLWVTVFSVIVFILLLSSVRNSRKESEKQIEKNRTMYPVGSWVYVLDGDMKFRARVENVHSTFEIFNIDLKKYQYGIELVKLEE